MSVHKTYVVRMSDGQQVRLKAIQQLGTPASPYFVNEKQDTIAGFGVVVGWWEEECEVNGTERSDKDRPCPVSTDPGSTA
jgi:hypothetical protein